MANEKRLIDANALLENSDVFTMHTKEYGSIEVIPVDAVGDAPTVDAVEVVRCKDCKYRKYGWNCDDEYFCGNPCYGMASGVNLRDADFCSYGERREGE